MPHPHELAELSFGENDKDAALDGLESVQQSKRGGQAERSMEQLPHSIRCLQRFKRNHEMLL
jgi:hypothetical protein